MSGRIIKRFGRLAIFLLCLEMIIGQAGCAPKNLGGKFLSDDDLVTCDATAAIIKEQVAMDLPAYMVATQPHLVTPAEAVINAPLNTSVLPFGPVKISFTQPSPDPAIPYRGMKVFITPIDTVDLSVVYYPFEIVPSNYPGFEITWNPKASGKFIILVMFRNFRPGGDMYGVPPKDFGPYSVAYVCVQIEAVTMQGLTANAVVVQPLEKFPTLTATTPVVFTLTNTPTFTPTYTLTPTLTLTNTPTLVPTKLLPSKTFTLVPTEPRPTEVTDTCPSYTTERECVANSCIWYPNPTGAPGECKKN